MRWFIGFLVGLSVLLSACSTDCSQPDAPVWDCGFGPPVSDVSDFGGSATSGGRVTVQMPFEVGTTHLCTQGAHGSYSHNHTSTRYALDFDVPNPPQERTRLYAPWSGKAWVFHDPNNFGTHVNIDLGSGMFLVLAHMHSVDIANGQEVRTGDYLGLSGSTGNSSGDHVHIGLQRGDASRNAVHSTSEPWNLFSQDMTWLDGALPYSSEEYVCGFSDGHHYESQLPHRSPNVS